MDSAILIALIILTLITAIIIYKIIKPYFIKYDSTIFITGGLGSGKTLTSVKIAIIQIRKALNNYYWKNKLNKITNFIIELRNKNRKKRNKALLEQREELKRPFIYSNVPIHYKRHIWSKKREWSVVLDEYHLTLLKEINENSIVLIDEFPQIVNQFNWNQKLIQRNLNEFITFFRQYFNGILIINAQATADIVAQVRRKGNQAIWCYNFKKHLFGLFYTIQSCDLYLNDEITSTSSTFIDDNTKKQYGFFPAKNTYDTRAYSKRVENTYIKVKKPSFWQSLKTNEIVRIQDYPSPLDDDRTEKEKQEQYNELKKYKASKK